jgi:hypothetical protein
MRVVTQRQQTPPGQTEPSRAGDAERSRADALRDRMDAMEAELVMAREPGASSQAHEAQDEAVALQALERRGRRLLARLRVALRGG